MSQINVTTIRNRTGGPPSLDQGVVVGSAATFSSTVSIAGTLTYEDVTNIDSVGIITARTGLKVTAGGIDVTAGGINVTAGIGTFSGDVSIADKIIHTGDTNTAIRFPAADTFTVETGGSERIRVASDGNFGIRTTSPTDDLHIAASASGKGILLKTTGDTHPSINFDANRSSAQSATGTIRGYWNGTNVAQVTLAGGSDTTNKDDGMIILSTSSQDNLVERVRINKDGNIGIGNIDPGDLSSANHRALQIHATSNSYLTLTNGTTGSTQATDGFSLVLSGNDVYYINRETTGSHYFSANGGDRLAIKDDGTVFVGATSIDWANATSTGIGLYPAAATNWLGIKNSSGSTATNTAFQINHGTTATTSILNNGKGTFKNVIVADRSASGDGCFHASLNGTVKASITSAGDLTAEACTLGRITAGTNTTTGFYTINAITNSSASVGWSAIYTQNKTAGGRVFGTLNAAGNAETITMYENGNVTCVALTESSDIALKTDIEPITNVLDKIQQITGYKYKFKNDGRDSMGVTAQDVEKVFPELVHGEDGSKSLQYSGLIGALIESVKELSNKVAALEL